MEKHFTLSNCETLEITTELAQTFSTMPGSVTERDLDKRRLAHLKEVILGGAALSFIWAQAQIEETGEVFRVNGHHSSSVCAELDGSLPAGLKAHLDTYAVPTLERLPFLFKQFDARRSARTLADIAGAYQMIMPELRDLPRGPARKAIEGVAWYEGKIVGKPFLRGEDPFDLFLVPEWSPFVTMVSRIYSAKTPEFTAAVIGCMCGSWQRAPADAEAFWQLVSIGGGGGLDENHPAMVLDRWLLDAREAEKKPKEMEVYRACALAWNRYRNHQTLDRITKFDPKKGSPELE